MLNVGSFSPEGAMGGSAAGPPPDLGEVGGGEGGGEDATDSAPAKERSAHFVAATQR